MVRHRFGVEPATIADPAAAIIHGVAVQGLTPETVARHGREIAQGAHSDNSGAQFIVEAKMAALIEKVAVMGCQQVERGPFGHE